MLPSCCTYVLLYIFPGEPGRGAAVAAGPRETFGFPAVVRGGESDDGEGQRAAEDAAQDP